MSVYDEDGLEIENVEVLCTDQGLFVYKAYSNGHLFDTSSDWVAIFRAILVGGYVPAIILPKGFPTHRAVCCCPGCAGR